MTQPRTETATLIKACRALEADCDLANLASITIHFSDDIKSDQAFENSVLSQIADRLEEQKATIHRQREAIKEFERYISEDAAEITTLRKTISDHEATIRNLEISFGKMTEMAAKDHDYIRHLRADLVERTSAAANHVAEIRDLKKKNVELECSLERELNYGWDRCRDI
jgi:chromosome segregation ATPase